MLAPLAITLNDAKPPLHTVALDGLLAIAGHGAWLTDKTIESTRHPVSPFDVSLAIRQRSTYKRIGAALARNVR